MINLLNHTSYDPILKLFDCRFMSETGFVSVEDQMKDLNLGEKEEKEKDS